MNSNCFLQNETTLDRKVLITEGSWWLILSPTCLGDISGCYMCAWMKVLSFHRTVFQWRQLSLLSFEVTSCTWLIRKGFKPGLNGHLWLGFCQDLHQLPAQLAPLPKSPKPGPHFQVPNFTPIWLGLQVFREVTGSKQNHSGHSWSARNVW